MRAPRTPAGGHAAQNAATLKEVAARAGVSAMTASRALNRPALVREDTRQRVEDAAKALGYRPNLSARRLAGGGSLFIGLVYDNPSDGYLGELLLGALGACREAGHHLVVEKIAPGASLADRVVARAARGQLDAIILIPPLSGDETVLEALRAAGVRTALIAPGHAGTPARVLIDDDGAAFAMTRYLIERGHRRIGFVRGAGGAVWADDREQGYRRALGEAGLGIDQALIAHGDYTYRSGLDAGAALLGQAAPPTAIFASNDDMAAGVLAAAFRAGLRVPEDLSVTGFDDTPIARTVWPQLTTMRQPISAMAAEAVGLIADQGLDRGPVSLPVELIERGSVAAPPRP